MMTVASYIERIHSLSKSAFEAPWRMELTHPSETDRKLVVYIADERHVKGSTFDGHWVVEAGEKWQYILDSLHRRAERYPYYWPLENVDLDPFGYDFATDMAPGGMMREIEVTDVAEAIVRERLSIEPPPKTLWTDLVSGERITGPGAGIRLQVKLQRAGSVNHIALELFSAQKVRLAGLFYQEDDSPLAPAKELSVADVGLTQSNRSLSIQLPEPVYAKTLTFVLVQEEYRVSKYALPRDVAVQRAFLAYLAGKDGWREEQGTDDESFLEMFLRVGKEDYHEFVKLYEARLREEGGR